MATLPDKVSPDLEGLYKARCQMARDRGYSKKDASDYADRFLVRLNEVGLFGLTAADDPEDRRGLRHRAILWFRRLLTRSILLLKPRNVGIAIGVVLATMLVWLIVLGVGLLIIASKWVLAGVF